MICGQMDAYRLELLEFIIWFIRRLVCPGLIDK